MIKYNDRVRAIAEEMARDFDNKHGSLYAGKSIEAYANQYMSVARIAVKHMADELRPFLEVLTTHIPFNMENVLERRGLIPDQEAGGNETE